jgi:predicted MFS family arabinose efflux permease
MMGALVLMASSAGTLALLTASGHLTLTHVIVLSMLSGVGTALYTPAMNSVVPSLVGPEQLLNAISLSSVQFNLARAVGPAIEGMLYGPLGPAGCFALNSAGFLAMALVVSRLHLPPRPAVPPPPIIRALREGLGYVRRHTVIGPAIFLAAVMSFFGFPYIVLLPAVAHGLGLDAKGLGWLMACVGGGAVTGGLLMSGLVREGGARFAVRGAVGFGLVLSMFGVVDTMAGTMIVLFFLGALQTMSIAALTTIIQTSVHDGMRGRVMSMVMVIFFGFSTTGGLVAGLLGDRITVPLALATGGVVTATVAVVLARSRTFT